ncbi:MAG: DUF87 domain-containing protein [Pseudomonadota bacterium]
MSKQQALSALRDVDFDWTSQLSSVWSNDSYHVANIHRDALDELVSSVNRLSRRSSDSNELGGVLVGTAGSGKTHLLGKFRERAMELGASFILCDMTDVNDFWDTLRSGIYDSLNATLDDGTRQIDKVLPRLFPRVGEDISSFLTGVAPNQLARRLRLPVQRLRASRFQYEARALLMLGSEDFDHQDYASSWLLGNELTAQECEWTGFPSQPASSIDIVEGALWCLSRGGPVVIAFDQLDAIISHSHVTEMLEQGSTNEHLRAQSIVQGIGTGLMSVFERSYRAITLVSCLEETWSLLRERNLRAFGDRFQLPIPLAGLSNADTARQLVEQRLSPAFREHDYQPPYATYPFKPEFFEQARTLFPRELLRTAHEHRRRCLYDKEVLEIAELPTASAVTTPIPDGETTEHPLSRRYIELQAEADLSGFCDQDADRDLFYNAMKHACSAFLRQNEAALGTSVDGVVDHRFGSERLRPLDVRIRLIDRAANDKERHFAFYALQRSNARAFQNRLRNAVTASGIDRNLGFRKLVIVRSFPLPGGTVTERMVEQFKEAGGVLHAPEEEELRALWALARISREKPEDFGEWLVRVRPLDGFALFQHVTLPDDSVPTKTATPPAQDPPKLTPPQPTPPKPLTQETEPHKPPLPPAPPSNAGKQREDSASAGPIVRDVFPLGSEVFGEHTGEPVTIPLEGLRRHLVALASAGSGKTVLVKRLIEEAALRGVPSVILDGANDMAMLGHAWPQGARSWTDEEARLARAYHEQAEVVVWTPGQLSGNPLQLEPLPNLSGLTTDELNKAVRLAASSLEGIVAPGSSTKSLHKKGVLASAMHAFASIPHQSLDAFIDFLADLPADAGAGIGGAQKLAGEMADNLRAERAINPLLRQQGTPLDPQRLFNGSSGKTRVSVVSLAGLGGLNAQQSFVAQLAINLFAWMKRHPTPSDHALGGLIVVDEAKDLVPSMTSVASKEPLVRLAAQARKYGFGLLLATQAPKSIDHNVIANCDTQFYGKASSPAALHTVRELLNQRGASGSDIAKLSQGTFYVHSSAMHAPRKVQSPLCLSYHSKSPPTEEEVMAMAARSRPSS